MLQFIIYLLMALLGYRLYQEVKKRGMFQEAGPKVARSLKLVVPLLLVMSLGFSSFYIVDETEFAVVTSFGVPRVEVSTPGLKFKLPYPIQRVQMLSRETFSLTFGYSETSEGYEIHQFDAKMITGDENIVLVDMEVQWRIVDPVAYLYHTGHPRLILENAVSSSLRGVVGSSIVDDVLTDGRARIINDVRDNLVAIINSYDMGISIEHVNLQDVDLPNEEVSQAFRRVTSAREERLTKINEANRYRNEKLNTALGQKEALISQAEGVKVTRVEQARGDVAKFRAIYAEYADNQAVTRDRLMIEALEHVLPGAKVYIMNDGPDAGTVRYLPLDTLRGGE